jgi:hypothetical protein
MFGGGSIAPLIHNIGLGWNKWLASGPAHLITAEMASVTYWKEYFFFWPQSRCGFCGEDKTTCPEQESKFDFSIGHSVYRLSYYNHMY